MNDELRMMNYGEWDRRGVTLPELLVNMFVFVLLGGVIASIYLSSGRFTGNEQLRIDVDVSANRVLTVMDQTLRQGKAVLAQYPTSGSPTYTTGDTALVLALPSTLVNGTLSATDEDAAVFYLDNGELKLMLDAHANSTRTDQTRTITTNVRDLYFRYNTTSPTSATAVTATITTEKTVLSRPYTQASILNVTFRNHP